MTKRKGDEFDRDDGLEKKYKPAAELKLTDKIFKHKGLMLTVGQFMGHRERVWFPRLFSNLEIFRLLTSDDISKPYWDKILEHIFTFFHWTIDDFAPWTSAGKSGDSFEKYYAPFRRAGFNLDDVCSLRNQLVCLQHGVLKLKSPPFTICERFFKKDTALLAQFKADVSEPLGRKDFPLEAVIYNPKCRLASLLYKDTIVDIKHVAGCVWRAKPGKCYRCQQLKDVFVSYVYLENRDLCSNCYNFD